MKFKKASRVTLPYDKTKLTKSSRENDIRVFYFDDTSQRWQSLPLVQVDTARGAVIASTTHFTDMIAGTITVPEAAAPQDFNPTSMSDIKPANAMAGVNLIAPPTANPRGDAALSYPIEIPPGRLGVQPSLQISYNSSGGNGWMGMGWNLQLPQISVDTRWGVPRYLGTQESETYSLDGAMLVPVKSDGNDNALPHRTALTALTTRSTGDQTFRLRIEGSYNKIVRHGTTPANYWWEVTDKQGQKMFFGGTPETGALPVATLAGGAGNSIARWALTQMRDTHGNRYTVTYTTQGDVGFAGGTINGIELYPASISYTANPAQSQTAAYRIDFIRDRQLANYSGTPSTCDNSNNLRRRCDVQINARNKFKTVTADRLTDVLVYYTGGGSDTLVRRYGFAYKTGDFSKTLLQSVVQYGASCSVQRNGDGTVQYSACNVFNQHHFAYNTLSGPGYGAAATYATGADDNVTYDVAALGRTSVISGSSGEGNGGHIYIGINPSKGEKSNSYGDKIGYDSGTNQTKISLIDINGDGRPDKVFINNGSVKFRLNTTSAPGQSLTFGPLIAAVGIDSLGMEKSTTLSFGPEGYPPGGNYMLNTSSTVSESPIYLLDANSDGLPDLAKNGTILFNRLDANGIPNFDSNNSPTPYPLLSAGGANPPASFATVMDDLQAQMNTYDPLLDTVQRWVAPYSGFITISGTVTLNTPATVTGREDGVRVAIQQNAAEKWVANIAAADHIARTPANVSAIPITAGDRIYFRVGSVNDASNDIVTWSPVITYVNAIGTRI